MKLLLNTGVVGQICHPRKHQDTRAWFAHVDHDFLISEVADYELRRELIRIHSTQTRQVPSRVGVGRGIPSCRGKLAAATAESNHAGIPPP